MGIIEQNWASMRCPILTGIFYPDDTVTRLDVVDPRRAEGPSRITSRERVPFVNVGPSSWTQLAELARTSDVDEDVTVVVGEAGMGGDGFVAAITASTGQLAWLAFFDCSNPFQSVAAKHGLIAARTNLDVEWTFPVRRPEQVATKGTGREKP
jgi:hypothetical protein